MAEVPQVARWQGGVFTRAQALAEGWTERQVRRRMATGAWARVAGLGLTGRARAATDAGLLAWAACLTWPNAVVSHQTAGLLHGFPLDRPEVAHVLVRDGLRRAFRIRAHHGRLGSADVDTWDGLAVTAPRRTALDCLAGLPPDQRLDLWAWLTSRGVITRQELAREVREGTGRHGTAALLALRTATRGGAVSVAERRLHELLRGAGILGWRAGAEILHAAW